MGILAARVRVTERRGRGVSIVTVGVTLEELEPVGRAVRRSGGDERAGVGHGCLIGGYRVTPC